VALTSLLVTPGVRCCHGRARDLCLNRRSLDFFIRERDQFRKPGMTSEPIRWRQRVGRVAVGGAVAAVLVAGCGGSDPATTKPEAAASTSSTAVAHATETAAKPAAASAVTVKQFQFMPAELSVKAGTNVTWTNEDDILHTATSGATPGTADGTFDGPMDGRGKSFSHVFDQSGRYPYFCNRHNSMTGTVVVE
jgi:plastocyanin